MHNQSWKTAVELDGTFVRVIEQGVVSIKSFKQQSDAEAFAQSEKKRLGLMNGQSPAVA